MRPSDFPPTYRSADSVVMKLMNFRSLDPNYGGKGLGSVGSGDREVWEEFASDRDRLHAAAGAIRGASATGSKIEDGDEGEFEAPEGRLLTRLHVVRERNRNLAERKKAAMIRASGGLGCEACGFDFARCYGDRGAGFIECHHTVPLHALDAKSATTKLRDLVLLCANCHRMIHARKPWLTVSELRRLLIEAGTAPG